MLSIEFNCRYLSVLPPPPPPTHLPCRFMSQVENLYSLRVPFSLLSAKMQNTLFSSLIYLTGCLLCIALLLLFIYCYLLLVLYYCYFFYSFYSISLKEIQGSDWYHISQVRCKVNKSSHSHLLLFILFSPFLLFSFYLSFFFFHCFRFWFYREWLVFVFSLVAHLSMVLCFHSIIKGCSSLKHRLWLSTTGYPIPRSNKPG